MSCNSCWPGNCHGGPTCENDTKRLEECAKVLLQEVGSVRAENERLRAALAKISAKLPDAGTADQVDGFGMAMIARQALEQ